MDDIGIQRGLRKLIAAYRLKEIDPKEIDLTNPNNPNNPNNLVIEA